MVFLIWCCVIKQLFYKEILILNTTDTASVFFRLNTDTDTSVFENHTEY